MLRSCSTWKSEVLVVAGRLENSAPLRVANERELLAMKYFVYLLVLLGVLGYFVSSSGHADVQSTRTQATWEYKVATGLELLADGKGSGLDQFPARWEAFLNGLGRDGWELVAADAKGFWVLKRSLPSRSK
jgi:hypothetical protein